MRRVGGWGSRGKGQHRDAESESDRQRSGIWIFHPVMKTGELGDVVFDEQFRLGLQPVLHLVPRPANPGSRCGSMPS